MLRRIRQLFPFFVLAIALAALAWFSLHAVLPVLAPAGPIGTAERQLMIDVVSLSAIVVLPVFALLFGFAWRYRDRGQEAQQDEWKHEHIAEFVWWLVPAAIICALGSLAWSSSHALDPYKPIVSDTPALTVDVVALDWKWLFIYPSEGIATVNDLEIPAGRPVSFRLTADAPMNSFWVPALGGQIMVMPGMETQLNLMASTTGTYEGYSANLSGEGFAGMHFPVRALTEGSFDAWAASVRAAPANPLTPDAYAALAKPSMNVQPIAYTSVAPELYESVIMQYMMPQGSTTDAMTGMTMPMPAAPAPAASTPGMATSSASASMPDPIVAPMPSMQM
ncbi:MAG TPA: COX aromatic rich motif-containing protein [Candidatus Paceibacterota bacterium]|nr:COX aromatic rich motif-containing protein [Candidatus Paceibacterota bacterium]